MIIDGKNTKIEYGLHILEGSYNSLLQYPTLKEPQKNDWAEFDGLEVDLVNPVLDKKEITLSVICSADKTDDLVNYLQKKTYHNFLFTEIEMSYKLRFIGLVNVKRYNDKCSFDLKLSNDTPLINYAYSMPTLPTQHNFNYFLDGVNFTQYAISVLDGTDRNLENTKQVKEKLEIESKFISGVKVFEQIGKKSEYTTTLHLFIKGSVNDFLTGYRAFLYDLIRPNERVLTANQKEYKCYYHSSKINRFILKNNRVWCQFNINLVIN